MGDIDARTKAYLSDPARFADAFNFAAYGGREAIKAEGLSPLDATSIALPFGQHGSTSEQRHRDVVKSWQCMRDDHAVYAIMGIENQTYVHYAMPVRNMLYDAMTYAEQVSSHTSQLHHNVKGMGRTEFLSGFGRKDKLAPVITLVIHFGTEPWDGPTSVRQMLHCNDEELLKLVPDYRLNLIDPSTISRGDLARFRSELGLVLGYIKYAGNRDALEHHIETDNRYRCIGRESAELINAITDSQLAFAVGEEKVDMCKAIQDMRAESRRAGEADGRRIGEEEGRRIGEVEGRRAGVAEGQRIGALQVLADLVRDGYLSSELAAERLGLDEGQFLEQVASIG